MGFGLIGNLASKYNTVNDKLTESNAMTSGNEAAGNFLTGWMTEKLPEIITGLAVRVVDDGSGTVAKEVLDAGKGDGFIGNIFR